MLLLFALLLATTCAAVPVHVRESGAATDVVETSHGPITGLMESSGLAWFRGVPFAAPPVGELRFRRPVAPTPWTEPRECTTKPNVCASLKLDRSDVTGSEDCLYLDVYSPKFGQGGEKKPVMVWIYGGGFTIGDAYEFGWYDGRNLANDKDVVFVAMNYRLGPFGFFASGHLAAEDADHSTGGYGIMDQRLALQWVQDNIAAFGGDPDNVTIFGQSAGGMSVCSHIASPASAGLFHKAIVQSGPCDSPAFFQPLDGAIKFGKEYGQASGCAPDLASAEWLSCMRGLSMADLLTTILSWFDPDWPFPDPASAKMAGLRSAGRARELAAMLVSDDSPFVPPFAPVMPFGPVLDGTPAGLTDPPITAIAKGNFNKVPVLHGHVKDEGTIFVPTMPLMVHGVELPLNDTGFGDILGHYFNATTAAKIRTLYDDGSSFDNRISVVIRDWQFACPHRRLGRALTSNGVDNYAYWFNYAEHWYDNAKLGDYHTCEIVMVMRNQWPFLVHLFSAADRAISDLMSSYWTTMAATGTPNADGAPEWPAFRLADDVLLQLSGSDPTPATDFAHDICDFWDTVHIKSLIKE